MQTEVGNAMTVPGRMVRVGVSLVLAGCLLQVTTAVAADDKPVYRCPGNLYTDAITAKEAKDRGCKTLDGAPITVIQSPMPRSGTAKAMAGSGAVPSRVTSDEQKARDNDARRILAAELQKRQAELAAMQQDYNDGQPERHGDERNYQKYLDRVNEMKESIARKEEDVEALKRELGAMGGTP